MSGPVSLATPKGSLLPYAWMLSGSLSFSVMAALAHGLRGTFDWQVIAAARTGVALVIALALALQSGTRLVVWRPRTLWIRSLAGSVSLVCMYYSLTRLPIADVLTLQNVFPVWVALLSWPVLGEVPGGQTLFAIGVALIGVVLIQQPHFAGASILPAAAAFTSSLATAISMLGLHRLRNIDPRAIVVHFSAVGLIVCLSAVALLPHTVVGGDMAGGDAGEPGHEIKLAALLMLLGVGLFATIGQLFLTKAFAAGPPAKVSVVALSQVGFGLLFDLCIWGHTFGLATLLGMVLVTLPTAWIMLGRRRVTVDDVEPV